MISERRPIPRWVWWGALFLVLAAAGVSAVILTSSRELPSTEELADRYRPPQTTRVLARDGSWIGEIFSERRTVVPLSRIPAVLIDAVIAAEDAEFRKHRGLDYPGIARAFFKNIIHGRFSQGASTITQQVARTFYLTSKRTLSRKIKELLLARKLENELSKDQILFLYLNQICFGHGRYGVEEASLHYFGKHVWEINLPQAAVLAGLPKGPSIYSPLLNMKAARSRQAYVLREMVKTGAITPGQADAALAAPLDLARPNRPNDGICPEAVDLAKKTLYELVGSQEAGLGGYSIQTSIDPTMQKNAREAVKTGLEEMDLRHHYPTGALPEAALVAIDPSTGDILAMVGSRSPAPGVFNRAIQARRQPGSAFKPFTYAAAIESRRYTAATVTNDSPEVFADWRPKNTEKWDYAGPVRLRDALAHSINMVAVKLILGVGPENVAHLARDMGIASPLESSPALALGASAVTPLEMASAYGSFASGGMYNPPDLVVKIEDSRGNTVPLPPRSPRQVLSPQTAYIMNSMLKSVIEYGTAARARRLRWPVAGKTGTSNLARDAWFVGYTPRICATVWVGFDDYQPLGRNEQGSRAALPIWIHFMESALKDQPRQDFPAPPDLEVVKIDPRTGLLPYDGMEDSVEEVFLKGTAPRERALPPQVATPDSFLMEQFERVDGGQAGPAGTDAAEALDGGE